MSVDKRKMYMCMDDNSGRARRIGPHTKNAGRTAMLNPLARNGPPHIGP